MWTALAGQYARAASGHQTDANVLQPGKPKRSSLFDAARRARVSICRGAPRPDTTRKPRRAGRGNGAARQRGGSAATRRPARFDGRDEHGEHPPVAPFEHRGTGPVGSWHPRPPHDAASSRARRAADDHGAQAVLVSDMVRCSRRPRLAQCGDLRWERPVSRALMSGLCRGACRWPSWVCACVPGTSLKGVLVAHRVFRYRLDCLDHSLSHHAGQRLLPEPSGSRPPPTGRAGASRYAAAAARARPFAW
jgi:hypothetical protein